MYAYKYPHFLLKYKSLLSLIQYNSQSFWLVCHAHQLHSKPSTPTGGTIFTIHPLPPEPLTPSRPLACRGDHLTSSSSSWGRRVPPPPFPHLLQWPACYHPCSGGNRVALGGKLNGLKLKWAGRTHEATMHTRRQKEKTACSVESFLLAFLIPPPCSSSQFLIAVSTWTPSWLYPDDCWWVKLSPLPPAIVLDWLILVFHFVFSVFWFCSDHNTGIRFRESFSPRVLLVDLLQHSEKV
jgi:hypothetical protein